LSESIAQEYDTELGRVVDRLRSMPISKLQAAAEVVHDLGLQLLASSHALGSPAPTALPELSPWAFGDMIMVLGRDLRALAQSEADLRAGLAALTSARRRLP